MQTAARGRRPACPMPGVPDTPHVAQSRNRLQGRLRANSPAIKLPGFGNGPRIDGAAPFLSGGRDDAVGNRPDPTHSSGEWLSYGTARISVTSSPTVRQSVRLSV